MRLINTSLHDFTRLLASAAPTPGGGSSAASEIIGINPDGKFIVSKYENNSTNRAVLAGIQRGDLVFDTLEGKYQRVSTSFSNGARAISDVELREIERSNSAVSYRFTDEEFTDGYNAQNLFSVLPASIQSIYQEDISWVEKLNLVLENPDLIIIASRVERYHFSEADVSSGMDHITTLSTDKLIQFNRKLLQEVYPECTDPNSFLLVKPLEKKLYEAVIFQKKI
jgi:hypothetical protein